MDQKINIPWSEPLMVSMNRHLGQLWNDWRCAFRAHFYNIAGKPPGPGNTALGKVHPHPDVPDKADWDWLCDFWSREAQLRKSIQNSSNREQLGKYVGDRGPSHMRRIEQNTQI